jgi:hypothetical protein
VHAKCCAGIAGRSYYSESDSRVPTWVVAGDAAVVGELTGLDGTALHGGLADTTLAARWLDDGIAPAERPGGRSRKDRCTVST